MTLKFGNYTLTRLLPENWEAYRDIRLAALLANPEMFGSNYNREASYTKADWTSFLKNDLRAMYALYHEDILVGLSGAIIRTTDLEKAVLFASFINPEHRGRGLSRLFYEARIDWARKNNCRTVEVSHRSGNEPSKAANQHFDFRYIRAEEADWPDGLRAEELFYELKI